MEPQPPAQREERPPNNRRRVCGRRIADRTRAQLAAVVDAADDAIMGVNLDGVITSWNRAAERIYGYPAEEIIGQNLSRLIPPDAEHKTSSIHEHLSDAETAQHYQTIRIRKDGEPVVVTLVTSPIRNDSGHIVGVCEVARGAAQVPQGEHRPYDTDALNRAQKVARDNEARWRSLFENAPIPIWEVDFSAIAARFEELRNAGVAHLDGYLREHSEEIRHLAALVRIIDMSHGTLETVKADSFEQLPHSLAEFFTEESLAVFRDQMTALWSGQRRFTSEITIRDLRGQPRLLEVRLSVVPGFERSLERVLASFMDITERRDTEATLRESKARYRSLAEGVPHILWETDAHGRALYYNSSWYQFVGRRPEDARNREWHEDFHPDDRGRLYREWVKSIRSKGAHNYDTEVRIRRHDGVYRWFRISGAPVRNSSGKIARWVGICADIDDQKRAAERLEFAQKAGNVGFYEFDFTTRRLLWAEGLAELFGLDPAQQREAPQVWPRLVVLKDAAVVAAQAREHVARRAEHFAYEFRAILPDGTRRWLGGRGRFVYDNTGRPVRLTGMNVDISERKRLEKELEERARQLAAADRRKDEFLATLAHELRNPLAAIGTSAGILRLKADDTQRVQWASDAISRQVQYLNHLVSDLLDLARVARGAVSLTLEPCELKSIVQRAVEMNRDGAQAKRQRLRVDLPKETLTLQGDPSRLVQVFSNLISNAVKYTPAGGAIGLRAVREDATVAVRVRDNGIGINPDLLPLVFDLFVQGERTLARAEGGLGIGLTLVKRITELHGGTVSVVSGGRNQGAEFTVRLPLAPVHAPRAAAPAGPELYPRTEAPRRILIVEDNRDAADSLAFLLADFGHDIRAAYDGQEGWKEALAYRPDVAIVDIGLPEISGYELAKRFRLHPELKQTLLIAMSGYGQQSDRDKSRAAGFDHHLVKPFEIPALNSILAKGDVHR